jgi:hypothetical protein
VRIGKRFDILASIEAEAAKPEQKAGCGAKRELGVVIWGFPARCAEVRATVMRMSRQKRSGAVISLALEVFPW